jgi:hypothetical protein
MKTPEIPSTMTKQLIKAVAGEKSWWMTNPEIIEAMATMRTDALSRKFSM